MRCICRFGCIRRSARLVAGLGFLAVMATAVQADSLPLVVDVEQQPLVAATHRLVDALGFVGTPLKPDDQRELAAAMTDTDANRSIRKIQAILDPYCLFAVTINPESRVSVVEGPAKKELVEQGWRTFLVKVLNQAGITPELKPESPNAAPLHMQGHGDRQHPLKTEKLVPPGEVSQRFLDIVDVQQAAAQAAAFGLAIGVSDRDALRRGTPANARRTSGLTSARGRKTSAFATPCRSCFTACRPSKSSWG